MDICRGEGTSTALITNGKKRLQTKYSDGTEMVEEYDLASDELVTRKWKFNHGFGLKKNSDIWEFEIGDAGSSSMSKNGGGLEGGSAEGLFFSAVNPSFHTRDRLDAFEWRVRNVPYPKDVYSLSVDEKSQEIILRTSNKKYYKRFNIPAMKRVGLNLEEKSISFSHENNTLIIQYEKPKVILDVEAKLRFERRKLNKDSKDGDVDCKQS